MVAHELSYSAGFKQYLYAHVDRFKFSYKDCSVCNVVVLLQVICMYITVVIYMYITVISPAIWCNHKGFVRDPLPLSQPKCRLLK